MRFFLPELQDSKYRALRQQRLWQIRVVGVSPRQAYKKKTWFGGLIPTYMRHACHPERSEGSYPSIIEILRWRSEWQLLFLVGWLLWGKQSSRIYDVNLFEHDDPPSFSDYFWIFSRWEAVFRAHKWETPAHFKLNSSQLDWIVREDSNYGYLPKMITLWLVMHEIRCNCPVFVPWPIWLRRLEW